MEFAIGRRRRAGDTGEVSTGARSVFTAPQRLALLAGFALLAALRIPNAWAQGRFLDEEGTIFFAYAWHRPAAEALWRSFGGYLNLGANAATLLAARLVRWDVLPLEVAPYLTMCLALLVQLLPAVLILTGGGRWLASRWAVVAALLTLAISPATEEVFLNVLHIQFHLALAAGLILALDVPARRAARLGYQAALFLAPLCGPGAMVLLPFYALRSLVDRSTARLAQTLVFAAGTALQLLVFFRPSPVRGELLDPATLGAILFVRLMALPFAAFKKANRLGTAIHASYMAGGVGWWLAAAAAGLFLAALVLVALRDRKDAAIWLIVPAWALAALSFGGGMINSDSREWFSVGAGERYNLIPLVLSTLGLIALARRHDGYHRGVCVALCALTLLSGIKGYARPLPELSGGAAWRDEVAAWRLDHDHPLATWPKEWTVDLSDKSRPCAPPRPAAATTEDPSYCESAWLIRVEKAIAWAKRPDRPD